MRWFALLTLFAAFLSAPLPGTAADGPKKKIVLIAGHKSHGYAGHEFNAGCLLRASRPPWERAVPAFVSA